ncbi:MAG: helix-turn-helix domain-containing protein [Acidobacteriaceae bacterium]
MRLAYLIRTWRYHEELSVREAAKRIGIPSSTLQRFEKGKPMSSETLVIVWRWMLEETESS